MNKLRNFLIPLALAIFATAIVVERASALSPSATSGHLTVTKGSGPPTGTPSLTNGDQTADYFDTAGSGFYAHDGTNWMHVSPLLAKTAVPAAAVVNSTTETTVYSVSVPGNLLRANNRLRLGVRGSLGTKASGPGTYTVKVKYGGNSVTVVSAATLTSNLSAAGSILNADIVAANATGTQNVYASYTDGSATVASTLSFAARGTTSTDSTTAQTLLVSWTFGTADAANSYTLESAWVELLN